MNIAPTRNKLQRAPAPRRRMCRVGSLAAGLATLVLCAVSLTSCAPPPKQLLLWGDSLAYQAGDDFAFFADANPSFTGSWTAFPGVATCDFLPMMRTDDRRPAVVVLAFSGNALTPCMEDANGVPLTGTAYLDAYRSATEQAIAIYSGYGAKVVLVTPPASNQGDYQTGSPPLGALYRQIATEHPGEVTVAEGNTNIAPGGVPVRTQPCMVGEPCEGHDIDPNVAVGNNIVRGPDLIHYCPTGSFWTCPVYSSGAVRYAATMAGAAEAAANG